MVTRRIHPSRNSTNVAFPRVLVLACAIQGIELNVRIEYGGTNHFRVKDVILR